MGAKSVEPGDWLNVGYEIGKESRIICQFLTWEVRELNGSLLQQDVPL